MPNKVLVTAGASGIGWAIALVSLFHRTHESGGCGHGFGPRAPSRAAGFQWFLSRRCRWTEASGEGFADGGVAVGNVGGPWPAGLDA